MLCLSWQALLLQLLVGALNLKPNNEVPNYRQYKLKVPINDI